MRPASEVQCRLYCSLDRHFIALFEGAMSDGIPRSAGYWPPPTRTAPGPPIPIVGISSERPITGAQDLEDLIAGVPKSLQSHLLRIMTIDLNKCRSEWEAYVKGFVQGHHLGMLDILERDTQVLNRGAHATSSTITKKRQRSRSRR